MQTIFRVARYLSSMRPAIAITTQSIEEIAKQTKLREIVDSLVLTKDKNVKFSFADKMLPFYSQQKLDRTLSEAEKKIAERAEYSGTNEAAESYHKHNP